MKKKSIRRQSDGGAKESEKNAAFVQVSEQGGEGVLVYTLRLTDPWIDLVFEERLTWAQLCVRVAELQAVADRIHPGLDPRVPKKTFNPASGRSHA